MIRSIQTKQFKITALVLALVLTLSCVFYNTTKVHAQELEIKNTSIQTFAGGGAVDNGKLVGVDGNPAEIGVFVTGGSEDKYNAFNVKWTHDGTNWTSDSPILYEGENSQQKIYAMYPYNEEYSEDKIVGGYAISIEPNQKDNQQIDYLYSEPLIVVGDDVSLTMNHLLTKLVLNVELGTEVEEGDKIAKVEVKEMYEKSYWWAEDDTWYHRSAKTTISMKRNSDTSFEALVLPICGCNDNDSCTSFPVVITMESGKVFKTDIMCPAVKMVDDHYVYGLAQGYQYNINLQVGQDVVALGNITATFWGKPVDGGQLNTN